MSEDLFEFLRGRDVSEEDLQKMVDDKVSKCLWRSGDRCVHVYIS